MDGWMEKPEPGGLFTSWLRRSISLHLQKCWLFMQPTGHRYSVVQVPGPQSCQCQWHDPSGPPADSACSSPSHCRCPGPGWSSPPSSPAPADRSRSTCEVTETWMSEPCEEQVRRQEVLHWPCDDFRVNFLQSLADEGGAGLRWSHAGIALQIWGCFQLPAIILLFKEKPFIKELPLTRRVPGETHDYNRPLCWWYTVKHRL